jgi:hypothetical protein
MKKLWQVLKVILILLGFLILWSLALNSYIPPENSYSFFELLSATVENFESENNTNMFYINFIYVLSIISFFLWRKNKNAEKNAISDNEIFGLSLSANSFLNACLSSLVVFYANTSVPLGVGVSIVGIVLIWIVLYGLSLATGDIKTKK